MAWVGGLSSPEPTASPVGSVTVSSAATKSASSTQANLLCLALLAVIGKPVRQAVCVVLGARASSEQVELHEFDFSFLQEVGDGVDELGTFRLVSLHACRVHRRLVDDDNVGGAAQVLGNLLHVIEGVETVGFAGLG